MKVLFWIKKTSWLGPGYEMSSSLLTDSRYVAPNKSTEMEETDTGQLAESKTRLMNGFVGFRPVDPDRHESRQKDARVSDASWSSSRSI